MTTLQLGRPPTPLLTNRFASSSARGVRHAARHGADATGEILPEFASDPILRVNEPGVGEPVNAVWVTDQRDASVKLV